MLSIAASGCCLVQTVSPKYPSFLLSPYDLRESAEHLPSYHISSMRFFSWKLYSIDGTSPGRVRPNHDAPVRFRIINSFLDLPPSSIYTVPRVRDPYYQSLDTSPFLLSIRVVSSQIRPILSIDEIHSNHHRECLSSQRAVPIILHFLLQRSKITLAISCRENLHLPINLRRGCSRKLQ